MIWFFLMGMIAGAVGMMMFAGWWVRSHATVITREEILDEIRETGHPDGDGDCDPEGRAISEPEGNDADGRSDMGSAHQQRMDDKD